MAVKLLTGPPGSGKKRFIKESISGFISSGKDISRALVLSNTKNSAREFRELILSLAGSAGRLWVESASSFCKKILRENYYLTSLKPGFRVISDFEKRLIVRNLLKRNLNLKHFTGSGEREGLVREISNFLDTARRSPGWQEKGAEAGRDKYEDLRVIYSAYRRTLESLNCIDLADLSFYTLELIKNHPGTAGFETVWVYEAEDLDLFTGEAVGIITSNCREGVVSLDISSAIYPFRGAEPGGLLEKLSGLPGSSLVSSVAEEEPAPGFFISGETRDEQARRVASHAASLIRSGIRPSEIVLIARSSGENMNVFTEALAEFGINSVITGGIGFFRQQEITSLISILTCVSRPGEADDIHVYRFLKLSGGAGEDELDRGRRDALLKGEPLLSVLGEDTRRAYDDLTAELLPDRIRQDPPGVVYRVMNRFGLLAKGASENRPARLYSYFFKVVSDFTELNRRMRGEDTGFRDFMDNIYDLLSGFGKDLDIPIDPETEAVGIMTVQQAKGRRFRVAYLVDMIEGVFPREFIENPLLAEEEQRLLGLRTLRGVEEQNELEMKLFHTASTRSADKSVFCWYETENDSSPAELSSFIDPSGLESLGEEITRSMSAEHEFLVKSAASLTSEEREGIAPLLPAPVSASMGFINRVSGFEAGEVHDRVVEGIPGVFSYSSLSSFRDCPAAFFLRSILRVREKDTFHKSLGIAVHRVLQVYHQRGGEFPDIISGVWDETGFTGSFERRNIRLIVKNIISAYLKAMEDESFTVTETEKTFTFSRNGINFTGRIDRVDRFLGAERIVDYKTGKGIPAEKGLLGAIRRGDDFQVPIYAASGNPGYFTIYRLRHEPGKMPVNLDLRDPETADALEKAWGFINEAAEGVRKGFFPPEPGNACRNCFFSRVCD